MLEILLEITAVQSIFFNTKQNKKNIQKHIFWNILRTEWWTQAQTTFPENISLNGSANGELGGHIRVFGEENINAIIMNPPLVPCIKHTHILLLIIISKYSIIKKKKTKLQVSSLCYHNHYHNYHNHYHNHKWRGCWATTHVSWHRLTFNSSLKNT